MIIGISGKIGHGKDTVAEIIQYLVARHSAQYRGEPSEHDFKEYIKNNHTKNSSWKVKKFADKLKDMVCMILGCTREQLEDREFKEKELGIEWNKWYLSYSDKYDFYHKYFSTQKEVEEYIIENQDKGYWFQEAKQETMTPRLMLQLLGTQCGRDIIHPNLWVNSLMSEYKLDNNLNDTAKSLGYQEGDIVNASALEMMGNFDKLPNWIITDMRFPNELKAVEEKEGITIRVNRNIPVPENQHESETALDNSKFKCVIENNGTLGDLILKVRDILEKII